MNIDKISAELFLQRREQVSDMLVVDVRTKAEMKSEFLQGSQNLPLQDITKNHLQDLIKSQEVAGIPTVYLLCGTGMRAEKAIEQLEGYEGALVIVDGGINALKAIGCSMNRGNGSVISLERQVRIAAGSFVLLGVVLGATVNPNYYALSAFVGAGLVFAGITDTCGMAMLLARMPWNR